MGMGDEDAGDAPIPEGVLGEVPRGAIALAGLTAGLMLLAWLAIYFLIFLPRGTVG
jgi:hypothetical protein